MLRTVAQPPPPPLPPGPPTGPQPWDRPAVGPPPARRWRTVAIVTAVVLVGAGVVALGLAGNDGEDGDGTPVPSGGARDRSPAPGLRLDDLEPALLTVDDVPSDYVEGDGDQDDGDEDGGDPEEELRVADVETDPACREALDELEGASRGEEGVLTSDVERPDDGAAVSHELRLASPDEPTVGELAELLGECDTIAYAADDEGTRAELRVGVEQIDGVGDAAIAVEMEVEVQGPLTAGLLSYGVLWSRGDVRSSVFVEGPFDVATLEALPPDRELARSAAEAVDARLREVAGG
jgi:hypothetical protein